MSKMKERWAELEQAAKDATPGPWIAGDDEDSDYFLVGPHDGDGIVYRPVVKLHDEVNAEYIATANPAAILELLEVTKGLAEALKMVRVAAIDMRGGDFNLSTDQWKTFHAALAKYEGG